jgi:glycosyltransferase involved in cell wall biosynthesis
MGDPGDADALRILLTVHHDAGAQGGAPGATIALAEELSARGHVVDVVGLGLLERARGSTIDAMRFPHVVGRLLRRRLDAGDCDVVDASSGDLAYVAVRSVRASSTAVFTRSHGLEHLAVARRRGGAHDGELALRRRYRAYHGGLRLWEVARSLRAADGALLLNEAEVQFATTSLHLARERIWTTAPVRRALRVETRAPRRDVLVLGPCSWRKGGDLSVRVLDALLRSDPARTASWWGLDEPAAPASELSGDVADRVELGASYDEPRLVELLATHRVLLFPSRFEGLPVTLLEALSAQLPIVGSDVPGVRDLLAGGAGVLVPEGHVDGMVAALRRLLADEAAQAAYAQRGLEVALRLSPGRVVDELVTAYRTVLAVKRPASN